MKPSPKVMAVVLNWCNEPDTAACIESLMQSSYDNLEILIVDNGSPDGSGELLHRRFPDVHYLQTGENLGYAGGNNRGVEWAVDRGAHFVLILNDDTVVDRDCVTALVRAAHETQAVAVVPLITYFTEPQRIWYAGGTFSPARALGLHDHENDLVSSALVRRDITFACGCCLLIEAARMKDLGGFDESFFAYVEDVDLSVRLIRAGCRIVFEPSARVLHRVEMGVESSPFQIRQRDRNRRRLARKHYGFGEHIRFKAWFYSTRAVHFLRYAMRPDGPRLKALIAGAIGRL